jgi:hypothetical protein
MHLYLPFIGNLTECLAIADHGPGELGSFVPHGHVMRKLSRGKGRSEAVQGVHQLCSTGPIRRMIKQRVLWAPMMVLSLWNPPKRRLENED